MSSAVELSTCGDASTELYSVAEEVRYICPLVSDPRAHHGIAVHLDLQTDPSCPGEFVTYALR